jgi:hypothetical protein
MCGRYSSRARPRFVELYRLTLPDESKEFKPGYNVAPAHVMNSPVAGQAVPSSSAESAATPGWRKGRRVVTESVEWVCTIAFHSKVEATMDTSSRVPLLTGCRWIAPPVDADGEGVQTWGIGEQLGFEAPRLFWLTRIAQGQWRGRHAHRESILATFAVNGYCKVTLDDGRRKLVVELRERGPGLIIGPWIWHDLFDFSADAAILVIASTPYTEAEYIRDYDAFLKEAADRPL